MNRYELRHADCREAMAWMPDGSIDAVVTDPPYHLTSIAKRFGPGQTEAGYGTDGAFSRASRGFMGQTWDGGQIAFDPTLWAEVLRVLKPGGYLVAFGGTRTFHRMACAIEDAGFEIRDQLAWLYGSGFPKAHDVSKALDKLAGATREVISEKANRSTFDPEAKGGGGFQRGTIQITAPATPLAEQWNGWKSALKPGHEPICLAQKPMQGTIAENILAHGVGAMNIDGCRYGDSPSPTTYGGPNEVYGDLGYVAGQAGRGSELGRFPANVLHDGSAEVESCFPPETSRFFYCAKASRADREEGCEGLPTGPAGQTGTDGRHMTRGDKALPDRANTHPTVKPTELMRWLVRLVTPPGGLVFDPFTGSGSTGKAALLEGARFIGAEMTAEYIPIARARIEWALTQPS